MTESNEPTYLALPCETRIVPIEFAGLWIAWNRSQTRIVAKGRTLQETADAAKVTGELEPVFAKVPRGHQCISGWRRIIR
ncbi:MAG TPA: hypothetical protein VE988_03180 [Gemmataceae bacterium]|nr:hypothetical protein [Gemmataceae bacterium]